MTHELKILPRWFEDVKSGKKNFEIRRADRNFKVGDTLVLKEYEHGGFTGREITRSIKYIYKGDGTYGISEDFCIIGLQEYDVLFLKTTCNLKPEHIENLRKAIIKQMEEPTPLVVFPNVVEIVNPNKEYAVIKLEQLKSDIECKYLNNYKYSAVTVACILNDLDNRIKELKGENDDT